MTRITAPRNRRRALLRATAVACTLVLAACGAGPGGDSAADGKVIRVALPTGVTSFANADIAVAEELGYFEEVGLSVEVSNLKSGSSVTSGVVGGSFEVGGASVEPVVNASAGGADIRVIGSYADRLEVELVTSEEIQSAEDLAGEPVGIQEVGAFREIMVRMVLQSADLTPDDAEYVSVSSEAYVSALTQDKIASAVLHPEQAIQAGEMDSSLHSLVNLYEIEPDYFYGAYFVSNDWLEANEESAQAFVEALTKAHRTMYDDREAVVPIIAEVSGFDEKTIDEAYDVYMTEVEAFPVNEGLEQDRLEYTVQRMTEMGTLPEGQEVDLNSLVDRGPITEAVKELGRVPERS